MLKAFVALDSGWFYLANIIGLGVMALVFHDFWFRVLMAVGALWDLYWMIRRIRKGPSYSYEQMLRESASATYKVSKAAMVAFVCSFVIAMGLVAWDAVDQSLGPEHPLSNARLGLRLGGLFAMAVCFAIVGTVTFRALRCTTRLRKGLCLKCGYDLRAHGGGSGDRCPECGSPLAAPAARPAA
jgi:hypothetical protein